MDWLGGDDAHWIWLAIGLVLATLELVVPGVYLIWLAVAALVTAGLAFAFDIGVAAQVIYFASLSLIAVFSAKRFLRDRPIVSSDPMLGNRTARLIGDLGVTTSAFAGGSGRIHHGDSDWQARGPDMAPGTRVRITGAEGSVLLVEPDVVQPEAIERAE